LAFEPIVAGGPNGGLPHAVPGDRPFKAGDWIVVDWGALVDGYASDITRMVVLGEPRGKMREIHEIVLRANEAGRAAVEPGVEAQAIDAAARAVIQEAGYGPHFMHRTGHGIGLEAHESPYIVAGNDRSMAPGMTFTVEPGIYLPELGGVRIEDDVVVTLQGAETLTTLPRAPFIVESRTT
ncbi:MAG: M24 family metallopeptidase, partial [Chloroflexi bacterium]|jgi:Xaa-Pro dipeptidase|nr:M24 family metallopeptidase [Chloroflexota bacterium]